MDKRQQEQRLRIDLLHTISDGYKRSIKRTNNIFGNLFNDIVIFIEYFDKILENNLRNFENFENDNL